MQDQSLYALLSSHAIPSNTVLATFPFFARIFPSAGVKGEGSDVDLCLVAGVLGLIPGVAYFLIGMETWMIFSIAHDYNVDNTGEIVFFCIKSGAISAVLKTVAHALHFAPLVGQVANSIVAMIFVFALHSIADSHYAHLSSMGKHPDTIPEAPHSQSPKR